MVTRLDKAGVLATGSTTERDLEDRFADIVNVKDWGALGDGTTDDYAAINAAKAVVAASGGTLYFPYGTYMITEAIQFTDASNFKVTGDHATIKAATSMGLANGDHIFNIYGCDNFIIENLILDGNKAGRSPVASDPVFNAHNLKLMSKKSTSNPVKDGVVRNVTSKNSIADGFVVAIDTVNPVEGDIPINILFENCIADSNHRNGLTIGTGRDITVQGGRYTNSQGNTAGPCAGIDIEADIGTVYPAGVISNRGIKIQDAYFGGNVGLGVNVNGTGDPEDCVISHCSFEDCGEEDIVSITGSGIIASSPCSITNNHFFNMTHTGSPKAAIIYIAADTDSCASITGNTFLDCASSLDENWCIYVHGDSRDYGTLVEGNSFTNITRAVLNYANGTLILNNIILTSSRQAITSGTDATTGVAHDCEIRGNTIKDTTHKGILVWGDNNRILTNRILEVASYSGGYISVNGAGNFADYNICEKDVLSTEEVAIVWGTSTPYSCRFNRWINLVAPDKLSDGTTAGADSAGDGKQSVQININGTTYKVLHDGTV